MDRIQLRRDTSARWKELNPVLLEGEPAFETDTKLRKIGDGTNAYNDLDYLAAENIVQELGNSETATVSQKVITDNIISSYDAISISDFTKGQDTSGSIMPNKDALVSDFFNVHAGKVLNFHYNKNNDEGYPFVTYFKYDKEYKAVGRNFTWFPISDKENTINIDEDAYFIRMTIEMSSNKFSIVPIPLTTYPDISISRSTKDATSTGEVIEISENELNTQDFIKGSDIDGKGITPNLYSVVNEKLFRVGKDKTINIQCSLEECVWVSIYLYDKDSKPISRMDLDGSYWKILKPVTSNIIKIKDNNAYYCRINFSNSNSDIDVTRQIHFSDNFNIKVYSIKDNEINEYFDNLTFEKSLFIDKQFITGKFISSDGVLTPSPNTASTIYRFPITGKNISVICENKKSYFWSNIIFYDNTKTNIISTTTWQYLPSHTIKTFATPEEAAFVVVNLINANSSTDVSNQSPFPKEFKLKVSEDTADNDSSQSNLIGNTIIVAKSGGNYTSINEAVQKASENDVVLVYPGIYKETIRGSAKVVNIQGICKEKCIVQMDTAERDNPPAELAAGYVANMTFIETGTAATKDIYTASRGSCGYGIHVDWLFSSNRKLIIENCDIISYTDPGIGIGLRPNFKLVLKDCNIRQLIDFDNHPNTEDIGALYMHESAGADEKSYNQNLDVIRCNIYGTGKYSIGLSGDHGSITDRSATFLSINSHYWANKTGKDSYYTRTTPVPPAISGQNVYLSEQSSGNNISIFNK